MAYKDPEQDKRYKADWWKRKQLDKEWREKTLKTHRDNKKQRRANDPIWKAHEAERAKEYRLRNRKAAIDFYGGKCACCGETRLAFLSLDHINGGGNKHRKKEKIKNLSDWACKNGFPDILQVLCHNCNMAKGFYGTCPHQLEGK